MEYSGEQVNRAGDKLRQADLFQNEAEFRPVLEVVSFWRSAHVVPLKHAFELVQQVALEKDRKAIFAKRLKRAVSIANKLRRFGHMDLHNMQDIGGCRAIVTNKKKLMQILRELKRLAPFRWPDHRFRIKDYIETPKPDGYRSVHLVGNFGGDNGTTRKIEVQLRTFIQHYWATALEIVDLFTNQALKSNQGDKEWSTFFRNVSEHFAAMDEIHMFDAMSPSARFSAYQKKLRDEPRLRDSAKTVAGCNKRLKVIVKLEAFAGSLKVVDDELSRSNRTGSVLLKIDVEGKTVETEVFPVEEGKRAEAAYAAEERETAKMEGVVVALVSSTAVGGIKEAYPNYFADSSQFLQHLKLILSA